ncbi:MAG: hypothetical protein ABFD90_17095 [Phycisphaerales bacterium]
MNWRTYFLLAVSILGAASLSCHGPETRVVSPKIAAEFDTSRPTQGSRDTETPKSEIKVPESDRDRESRIEKMRRDKEMIMLVGLIDSFM